MQKITFAQFSPLLLLIISACLLSQTAYARDISSEQNRAREARKTYQQKRSNYDNLSMQLKRQEQVVADEQTRLDSLKANHSTAKSELGNAKVDLDTKVQQLNDVWHERNR